MHYPSRDLRIKSVEIGGIVVSFCSRIVGLDCILNKKYCPFLTSKKPDLIVNIDHKNNAPQIRGKLVFEVKNRYDILENKQSYIFKLYPDRKPNSNSQFLFLDKGFKKAEFFIPRLKNYSNRNLFDYPLDQLLMLSILWRKKGIFLHSSAITIKNKAFIFLGCSGAGKTTISRILDKNGWPVLSDDRIIVRNIKGKLIVFGTPWSGAGDFFDSRRAALGKIFFLCHGKKNRLTRISGRKALGQLLTCAFVPYWDKPATKAGIDMAASLAEKAAFYKLEFFPDDSIFNFLNSYFNG